MLRTSAALVSALALAVSAAAAPASQAAPARAPQTQPQQAQPRQPAQPQVVNPKSIEIPGPIKAEPATVDFGFVEPGTTVSATIKLINPLDRPVTIGAAKPTCTCTTVDMVGKVIPAGGFIEMPMSMKTSQSVGNRSAAVNMAFEGIRQILVVELRAETAYTVRATPSFIDARAPESMKGSFEVVSADGAPFSVLSVDGKPPVTLDGSPMQPAAKHVVRYDFTTEGGLRKGVPPFLIVETDHPKSPVIDLRVRHETTRITPALGFAEFRANCGEMKPKGAMEFDVEIKMMGKTRIERIQSLDPRFQTDLVLQRDQDDLLIVRTRVTDLGQHKGPFLVPCRFFARGRHGDYWLFGTVR
ncbi:MAG: DUF1573 domain-containing protein [Phycisphaera sp.]|nr:DUF1573 domain-containing protein [Phycisphaera sp.]